VIERLVYFAENRYTRIVLVALMFLSLQTTFFNEVRPFGVCLQVMLLLAAASGLARGSETGAINGFIIGLLYDMVLSTPLGLHAVVFAIVGYLAGFAHSFVHEPTWWSRMILASAASIVGMFILPFTFMLTGVEGVLTPRLFTVAIVVAVFNAVFAVPVDFLCRWALREPVVTR
jgi:rod shape-determining protein MreD